MSLGMVMGIVGSVIGLLGGVIGTYHSLENTRSHGERRLAIKFSAAVWVLVAVFLAGVLLIPSPYGHLLWLPYGLLLHFAIRRYNAAQDQIIDSP